MAIINTLPKCLDSPYLTHDPEAPGRVGRLLAFARDRLAAASDLVAAGQGDSTDVALFRYEAMFACLRALLARKGYRELGLRCLLLAIEGFYVRNGELDVALVHGFERAMSLRTTPAEGASLASALMERASAILETAA